MRVLQIYGTSLSLEDVKPSDHPNAMNFKGVLVRLDEPSSKPPHGAEGHRILVTTEVAKKRLSTLIGMGINYDDGGGSARDLLQHHSHRHKVGVIQKAWIDGKDLCVSGIIWKHDFPEAQQHLKQDQLGMSMELGEVYVNDTDADIWELSDCFFIGATILYRNAAAYNKTHLIAAKADERSSTGMLKKKQPATAKASVTASDPAIAKIAASQDTIVRLLSQQNKSLAELATRVDNLEIASAAITAGEEVKDMKTDQEQAGAEEDAAAVNAKKAKDEEEEMGDDEHDGDEDDEEDLDSSVDKGDLEELGPALEDDADSDDEPGHLNKGSKNKGDKTAVEDKLGKTVQSSRIINLANHVARLQKELAAANERNSKLEKKMNKVSVQVAAAADRTDRKSISAEISGLLAKSNLDARQIQASGQRLTPTEIDAVLANSGISLDIVKRIALKSEFVRAGIMDEGVVDRGLNIR